MDKVLNLNLYECHCGYIFDRWELCKMCGSIRKEKDMKRKVGRSDSYQCFIDNRKKADRQGMIVTIILLAIIAGLTYFN